MQRPHARPRTHDLHIGDSRTTSACEDDYPRCLARCVLSRRREPNFVLTSERKAALDGNLHSAWAWLPAVRTAPVRELLRCHAQSPSDPSPARWPRRRTGCSVWRQLGAAGRRTSKRVSYAHRLRTRIHAIGCHSSCCRSNHSDLDPVQVSCTDDAWPWFGFAHE